MGQHDPGVEKQRFGRYLRSIRERRRLSLDAVEEMSLGYPERLTKSHLSRIENGQAVPTFPRMFALSRIYGVPIANVAEQLEMDLDREMHPADLDIDSIGQVIDALDAHRMAGRYREALALVSAALDRLNPRRATETNDESTADLRLYQINCLVHLERYETAKVRSEELLNCQTLSDRQRLWALLSFVTASYRLRRYTVAQMGLERVERELNDHDHPPKARAVAETIRGPALFAMGRIDDAAACFARALQWFRDSNDRFQACKARLNLAQALIELGEPRKARVHLSQALKTAEESGYDKLRALGLSHLAVVFQQAGDQEAAESYALRSNSIARPREYVSIVFRNCYYLREIAEARGDVAAVNSNERTLKAYVGRVEAEMPEAIRYRSRLAGDTQ